MSGSVGDKRSVLISSQPEEYNSKKEKELDSDTSTTILNLRSAKEI